MCVCACLCVCVSVPVCRFGLWIIEQSLRLLERSTAIKLPLFQKSSCDCVTGASFNCAPFLLLNSTHPSTSPTQRCHFNYQFIGSAYSQRHQRHDSIENLLHWQFVQILGRITWAAFFCGQPIYECCQRNILQSCKTRWWGGRVGWLSLQVMLFLSFFILHILFCA